MEEQATNAAEATTIDTAAKKVFILQFSWYVIERMTLNTEQSFNNRTGPEFRRIHSLSRVLRLRIFTTNLNLYASLRVRFFDRIFGLFFEQ